MSEMISGGVECIVGILHDEAFGPVVIFGLGGVFVEMIKDTACALAPVGIEQARIMIEKTKTYCLLDGYRGGPRYDVDELAKAVSDLSIFAKSHCAEIATIDGNPLVVLPVGQGVIALDAVIETNPVA